MISEYLAYRSNKTVNDVLDVLQIHREEYEDYDVQYLYVTDSKNQLAGVLRIKDILFPQRDTRLKELVIKNPHSVTVDSPLDE